MKNNVVFFFVVLVLIASCTTNKNIVKVDNKLPDGAKSAISEAGFEKVIENEAERYPTTVTSKISGDMIIIMASLDLSNRDTSNICYDNVLSLGIGEKYIRYLNWWFFEKQDKWGENLAFGLSKYNYLYVVELRRDNMKLQIHGKIIQGAKGDLRIEIKLPVYLNVPGWVEAKITANQVYRTVDGQQYIPLGPAFDPIQKEYTNNYLVYKFFNRKDKLEKIPTPQH